MVERHRTHRYIERVAGKRQCHAVSSKHTNGGLCTTTVTRLTRNHGTQIDRADVNDAATFRSPPNDGSGNVSGARTYI
jgi:hypothetical protein